MRNAGRSPRAPLRSSIAGVRWLLCCRACRADLLAPLAAGCWLPPGGPHCLTVRCSLIAVESMDEWRCVARANLTPTCRPPPAYDALALPRSRSLLGRQSAVVYITATMHNTVYSWSMRFLFRLQMRSSFVLCSKFVPRARPAIMDAVDEEGEAALAALDAIDAEGEAALAELEEEELSAHDAIAELQRRGARPVLGTEMPVRCWAPSSAAGMAATEGSAATASVTWSTPPAAASVESSTCTDCQNARSQAKFYEAFGLHVCYDCQRANRGAGAKYQVITKSKAKDEYLLNDRQLDEARGGLGNIRLPNPNDKRYGDMRLYLRSQVEELAFATWGSSEELLLEKERRSEERLNRAEAKRKLKSGTPEEQVLARCGGHSSKAAKQRKGRAAAGAGEGPPAIPAVVRSAPRHTHAFLLEEEYCEATDMWTKRCACGFAVEYERL